MFRSALRIADELAEFGHQVLYAPKNMFFLTSDSPVFTLQPEPNREATIGVGCGWARVQVHSR